MTASSSDALPPPAFLARGDGLKLAYRKQEGRGPTIIFLPGYKSDMLGGKAEALSLWATQEGRALLRLDYSGCGESQGAFADGTLELWRDDALYLINELTRGPVLLVGSSMGGWLALLLALALKNRVIGLVGIAAAPDFTDWGFDAAEKAELKAQGQLLRPSDYGDPMLTTLAFWQSGERCRLLDAPLPLDCPVRLIQGQRDDAVPWETALRLSDQLCSGDVQVTLIKDGDHRLSRDADIALLIATIARLVDQI